MNKVIEKGASVAMAEAKAEGESTLVPTCECSGRPLRKTDTMSMKNPKHATSLPAHDSCLDTWGGAVLEGVGAQGGQGRWHAFSRALQGKRSRQGATRLGAGGAAPAQDSRKLLKDLEAAAGARRGHDGLRSSQEARGLIAEGGRACGAVGEATPGA